MLGLFSIMWSALPFYSLYFAFQNIVFLVMSYQIFSALRTFIEVEDLFLKLTTVFICIDALGDIIINGLSFMLNWHNLETGGLAAMLLSYCIAEFIRIGKVSRFSRERRKKLRKYMSLSALVLIASTSSASNVSALCGILAIVLLGKNVFLKFITGISIFLLVTFPQYIVHFMSFLFPGKDAESIRSAGSRMHIWEPIFELIRQRPILGWGYGASERIIERAQIDSHNSIIGALGGLGLVGGSILILFMLSSIKVSIKHKDRLGYLGLFAACVSLIVNSNTFGFLSGKTSMLTLGFFMVSSLLHNYVYYEEKFK